MLSEYGLANGRSGPCTSIACCATTGSWPCATSSAPTRSTLGRARRSRSPITRWRTCTCAIRHVSRRSRRCSPAVPGVEAVLDRHAQAAHRPRSRTQRRTGCDRAAGRVVHLLLLAGRHARAGLRAHRRHSPQARVRPRRAVPRSDAALSEDQDRGGAREEGARFPVPAGGDPARRDARPRVARAHHRRAGRWPRVHLVRKTRPDAGDSLHSRARPDPVAPFRLRPATDQSRGCTPRMHAADARRGCTRKHTDTSTS